MAKLHAVWKMNGIQQQSPVMLAAEASTIYISFIQTLKTIQVIPRVSSLLVTRRLRHRVKDKTSIMVSAHDKAGALIEILKPLSYHGVSMTSIETRPERPNKWAYVFFIDMDGHIEDANVSAAIADIRPLVKDLRILGSYPKAVL